MFVVCGPGAAPIGRRVVEVIQLSQLFLADPVQAHRPHRSLQLHESSGLSNSSEIQSRKPFPEPGFFRFRLFATVALAHARGEQGTLSLRIVTLILR